MPDSIKVINTDPNTVKLQLSNMIESSTSSYLPSTKKIYFIYTNYGIYSYYDIKSPRFTEIDKPLKTIGFNWSDTFNEAELYCNEFEEIPDNIKKPVSEVLPNFIPKISYTTTNGMHISNFDELKQLMNKTNVPITSLSPYFLVKHSSHHRNYDTTYQTPTQGFNLIRKTHSFCAPGQGWCGQSVDNFTLSITSNGYISPSNFLHNITPCSHDTNYDLTHRSHEYYFIGIQLAYIPEGYSAPSAVFSQYSSNWIAVGGMGAFTYEIVNSNIWNETPLP